MYEFSEEAARHARQAALDLQSTLRERASKAESERRLSDDTVAAISDAALFRMAVPRRVAGSCLSTRATADVVATLAQGCASAAWVVAVSNSNAWLASLAPPRTVDTVFREGVPIVCGATAPSGRSEVTPTGRKITGRWGYLSGSSHASWAILSLSDKAPDGKFAGASAYVPMSDVAMEDTWFVSGLRATSSNTGVVDFKALPEHLYVTGANSPARPTGTAEPSDYVTMVPQFRVFLLSVMLGVARSMVSEVIERAKKRSITYSIYRVQSESAVAQRDLGEAAAMVQGASEITMAAARQIDECALEGRVMMPQERAQNRGQTALANQLLTAAAEQLMFLGGASAFSEDNPLQRHWRDIGIASRHGISVPSLGFELAGRSLLGVDGDITPSPELI